MSAHATAVVVAKVLTIITTLMMRVSLLPDFSRMHRNHSTGDMSVMPCLLLFVNCYAVMFYAIAINDMLPLFATSVLGIVTGVFFNYFFYRWTAHKRHVMKIFVTAFFVCIVITVYSVLAIFGRTGQSHSSVDTTMGFMTIGTTVGMYMSPMATIVRVIRTKTASSMPFTMGIVNVLNSFCWALYSGLVGNMFILAPNIAGLSLGTTQLVLTYIYRRKPPVSNENLDGQAMVSVVIESPTHAGNYERKLSGEDGSKSPNFVSIQSPKLPS
ncbi:3-like protein [Phytophthora cinnamomi]|uniref:3-like protein n=1 Tax=Phytophthora cinnamomi TaxID=4785 RepID=UPI003559D0DC|nr:3-like protein [Phytophthora cinnamomi]